MTAVAENSPRVRHGWPAADLCGDVERDHERCRAETVPSPGDVFTRVLVGSAQRWIATKRQSIAAGGIGTALGFECHLHDPDGRAVASFELPPQSVRAAARVVFAIARNFDAELIVVCAEGLVHDGAEGDVVSRFANGDRAVDEALVITVGERVHRRVSSVQFPFVYAGPDIRIASVRAGDRTPSQSQRIGRFDPVVGPIASAMSIGFNAPSPHGSRQRATSVMSALRTAGAKLRGAAVAAGSTPAAAGHIDAEVLAAIRRPSRRIRAVGRD